MSRVQSAVPMPRALSYRGPISGPPEPMSERSDEPGRDIFSADGQDLDPRRRGEAPEPIQPDVDVGLLTGQSVVDHEPYVIVVGRLIGPHRARGSASYHFHGRYATPTAGVAGSETELEQAVDLTHTGEQTERFGPHVWSSTRLRLNLPAMGLSFPRASLGILGTMRHLPGPARNCARGLGTTSASSADPAVGDELVERQDVSAVALPDSESSVDPRRAATSAKKAARPSLSLASGGFNVGRQGGDESDSTRWSVTLGGPCIHRGCCSCSDVPGVGEGRAAAVGSRRWS